MACWWHSWSCGLILPVSTYRMSLEELSAKLIWAAICILSHNSMVPQTLQSMLVAEQHFSWCGRQLSAGVKLVEMLLSDIFWGKPDFSSTDSIQKTLSISPIIFFLSPNTKSTHMCVWLPDSCRPLGKIRRQKTELEFCLSEQMRIIYMYKLFIERLQQAN